MSYCIGKHKLLEQNVYITQKEKWERGRKTEQMNCYVILMAQCVLWNFVEKNL